VSLRPSDHVPNDGTFDPTDPIGDDIPDERDECARGLDWLCRFSPPAVDPEVQPMSVALPGYLKQGVAHVGTETGCGVLAYTATGALHRGVDWLRTQAEVSAMERARHQIKRAGWSTAPLDWTYPLQGCGNRDHIELRRVGKVHSARVHRLKDAFGVSLRVAGGLCILFGIVDLNLRGAIGRQASEQARDFLAQLESRVVLAKDLAGRAMRDPAPITSIPRNQRRSHR
jgi:hypothetical protein